MDKSALHAYVQTLVDKTLKAQGLDDSKANQVVGRSLVYAALARCEKDILAAAAPPAAKK